MNFTVGSFITGLIMIAIGVYFIYDSYRLNHQILYLAWAEKRWGPGGGTLAYKGIGMALIVFAFFIMTGLFNPFGNPLESLDQNGTAGTTTNTPNFTGGSGVQLSN